MLVSVKHCWPLKAGYSEYNTFRWLKHYAKAQEFQSCLGQYPVSSPGCLYNRFTLNVFHRKLKNTYLHTHLIHYLGLQSLTYLDNHIKFHFIPFCSWIPKDLHISSSQNSAASSHSGPFKYYSSLKRKKGGGLSLSSNFIKSNAHC